MKFDDWLANVRVKRTKKGARINLRLYVYPDSHGNFYITDKDGRIVEGDDGQPVNNTSEALNVFEKVWNRAVSVAAAEPEKV